MTGSGLDEERASLFGGTRFWISQNVPQRTRFKEMITHHGGCVVLLEKDADVRLVDHTRKNLPSDTFSYQYVERSVLRGRLENLESHRAGPSAPRPMGASNIPKKGTRRPFSLQDDQIVFDWLVPFEKDPRAPTNGRKIYEKLEERFPQHTWQSWRTRYLKILRGKPRPGGGTPRPELISKISEEEPHGESAPAILSQKATSTSPDASQTISSSSTRIKRSVPDAGQEHDISAESSPMGSHEENPTAKKQRTHGPSLPLSSISNEPQLPERAIPSSSFHSSESPPPVKASQEQGTMTVLEEQLQGLVNPTFLEMPFLPSSSEPEDEDDAVDSDSTEYLSLNQWIKAQVDRGSETSIVLNALRASSMKRVTAKKLIEILRDGNDIPNNIQGVWTGEDDECLEGPDARGIERVLTKHGQSACNARWEYLSMARERGLL
ncbi:hypothetical protein N7462_010700 [Penicillium macrosclerotiorum]|uniref:uncharacterized protein n=1 Tax=Penicillium macrosclerotiorum TaxID=303699 RepID=UPI0025478BC4|nr:uncharacterized protein N7462_010700 [Penicillium macrosclerotiorum]KAJ5669630.1 hypothetical protein N7462_010700 [Penicillium macrosclerotiorum]